MAASEAPDPSYTVIIRVPFPRGDFVDPPPVQWDAAKDKSLWKVLSNTPKHSDLDWSALASEYDVSLTFLLQQAAYLYDQQFSQVRAQLRRVGAKSSAPSPIPGAESNGGEAMRRTGSGGGRAPSAMSTRKDSPITNTDGSMQRASIPNRAGVPPISRNSSANTTIQVQSRYITQTSPRPAKAQLHRRSITPPGRPRPASINTVQPTLSSRPTPLSPSDVAESSSEESSDSDGLPAQSRIIRRPRFASKLGRSEDADDDDDAPTFLPFTNPPEPSRQDPSATLRGDPRQLARRMPAKKPVEAAQQSQTSDSSASSTPATQTPSHRDALRGQQPTGPISARRTAELAGRSPSNRSKGMGKDGSDETPSMGSSFSDLDDASVTQSALEEALASNMQHGGMASRMSTISQALRSRYL